MATRYLVVLILSVGVVACSDSNDCPADMIYDQVLDECVMVNADCSATGPKSLVQECSGQNRACLLSEEGALCGACLPGYTEEADQCRPVAQCSALDCAFENRACIEAAVGSDALCGDCLPGWVDSDSGTQGHSTNRSCVQANCSLNDPGTIREACEGEFKNCVEEDGSAVCGDCWHGYVADGQVCQSVTRCYQLGCVDSNRLCVPAGAHSHAYCGTCLAGTSEQDGVCLGREDAVCDAAPAEGSILDACEAANRNCVLRDDGAVCGGCKDGFVEDINLGLCLPPTTCADLDCAALNRHCEDKPTGHCANCLPDFIPDDDTGECRLVVTCDQITCQSGEVCAKATSGSDAFCRKDCGPDAIWSGSFCEPCPPCDALGEVGRWPWLTQTNNCICETESGFFYSLSAEVGTFSCDADNDGWVRESARVSLESTDPAMTANARCDLRTIDRFVLRNDSAQEKVVILSEPLDLYESNRNDDDFILGAIWKRLDLPQYGSGAWTISANQLNRLTKLCHEPRTDYNDNSIPDVAEWGDRDLAPGFRVDQKPFNEFSYFMEFYRGWYEESGPQEETGRYVIAEKSRLSDVPDYARVAVAYPEADGDHWRTCQVLRDSEWDSQYPPIGMDLAKHNDVAAGFNGMNHHSQFKCVVVEDQPDESIPNQMSPAQIDLAVYRINTCTTADEALVRDGNPAEPIVGCDLIYDLGDLAAGDAVWAALPYVDHGRWASDAEYIRGCVNECIQELLTCPGYDVNPRAVDCAYDEDNFGKFVECLAWEVCDGADNDFDGLTDEDNPEAGDPCAAGQLGQCDNGETRCDAGQIVCDQVVLPVAELCNNLDEDCNGVVEYGDPDNILDSQIPDVGPQGGGACLLDQNQGECRTGIEVCLPDGLQCLQRYGQKENEGAADLTCNSLDDDCDGVTDPDPDVGSGCELPRKLYFPDNDGDGYGDAQFANIGRCLCGPKVVEDTNYSVTNAGDCCDRDEACPESIGGFPIPLSLCMTHWYTSPERTGYSGPANNCGNWNWNCDNIMGEQLYPNVGEDDCSGAFWICSGTTAGWVNAPAQACGTGKAPFYTGGCGGIDCGANTDQRTQQCR